MTKSLYFFYFFLFSVSFLFSREEMPWFHEVFQIRVWEKTTYQTFSRIESCPHSVRYNEDSLFADFGMQVSPWENMDVELEIDTAHTTLRRYQFDSFSLTYRYLLLDDLIYSPVSFAIGATLIKGWRGAKRDPAVFYPGQIEGEFHVAVGKELPCAPTWRSRVWSFFAIGIADVGYPWLRVNLAYERNRSDRHVIRFFANSLFGTGKKCYPIHCEFKGYGPIRYKSFDLGTRYTYKIPFCMDISLEYLIRVYAKNFPKTAQQISLLLSYPLNL